MDRKNLFEQPNNSNPFNAGYQQTFVESSQPSPPVMMQPQLQIQRQNQNQFYQGDQDQFYHQQMQQRLQQQPPPQYPYQYQQPQQQQQQQQQQFLQKQPESQYQFQHQMQQKQFVQSAVKPNPFQKNLDTKNIPQFQPIQQPIMNYQNFAMPAEDSSFKPRVDLIPSYQLPSQGFIQESAIREIYSNPNANQSPFFNGGGDQQNPKEMTTYLNKNEKINHAINPFSRIQARNSPERSLAPPIIQNQKLLKSGEEEEEKEESKQEHFFIQLPIEGQKSIPHENPPNFEFKNSEDDEEEEVEMETPNPDSEQFNSNESNPIQLKESSSFDLDMLNSKIGDPYDVNINRAKAVLAFMKGTPALTKQHIESWHGSIIHLQQQIASLALDQKQSKESTQNEEKLTKFSTLTDLQDEIRLKFDEIITLQHPEFKSQLKEKISETIVPAQNAAQRIASLSFFKYGEPVQAKEDRQIEFKNYQLSSLEHKNSYFRDTLKKTIVSFLNEQGGTIYMGIRDYDGTVQGVDLARKDMDLLKLRVNEIQRQIEPDCNQKVNVDFMPIMKYEKFAKGKWVVRICVEQGNQKSIYAYSQSEDPYLFGSAFREDGSTQRYGLAKFLSALQSVSQNGRKLVPPIKYASPDSNAIQCETNQIPTYLYERYALKDQMSEQQQQQQQHHHHHHANQNNQNNRQFNQGDQQFFNKQPKKAFHDHERNGGDYQDHLEELQAENLLLKERLQLFQMSKQVDEETLQQIIDFQEYKHAMKGISDIVTKSLKQVKTAFYTIEAITNKVSGNSNDSENDRQPAQKQVEQVQYIKKQSQQPGNSNQNQPQNQQKQQSPNQQQQQQQQQQQKHHQQPQQEKERQDYQSGSKKKQNNTGPPSKQQQNSSKESKNQTQQDKISQPEPQKQELNGNDLEKSNIYPRLTSIANPVKEQNVKQATKTKTEDKGGVIQGKMSEIQEEEVKETQEWADEIVQNKKKSASTLSKNAKNEKKQNQMYVVNEQLTNALRQSEQDMNFEVNSKQTNKIDEQENEMNLEDNLKRTNQFDEEEEVEEEQQQQQQEEKEENVTTIYFILPELVDVGVQCLRKKLEGLAIDFIEETSQNMKEKGIVQIKQLMTSQDEKIETIKRLMRSKDEIRFLKFSTLLFNPKEQKSAKFTFTFNQASHQYGPFQKAVKEDSIALFHNIDQSQKNVDALLKIFSPKLFFTNKLFTFFPISEGDLADDNKTNLCKKIQKRKGNENYQIGNSLSNSFSIILSIPNPNLLVEITKLLMDIEVKEFKQIFDEKSDQQISIQCYNPTDTLIAYLILKQATQNNNNSITNGSLPTFKFETQKRYYFSK